MRLFTKIATCALALSATVSLSHGTQFTWAGTSDSLWSTATNWSPATVPSDSDTVVVSGAGNIRLTAPVKCKKLSLTAEFTGALSLDTNKMTISNFSALGGTINAGSDTLTIEGLFDLSKLTNFNPEKGTVVSLTPSKTYFTSSPHSFNNLVIWLKPSSTKSAEIVFQGDTVKVKKNLELRYSGAPSGKNAIFDWKKNSVNFDIGGNLTTSTRIGGGGNAAFPSGGNGVWKVKGDVVMGFDLSYSQLHLSGDSVQTIRLVDKTKQNLAKVDLLHNSPSIIRLLDTNKTKGIIQIRNYTQVDGTLDLNGVDLKVDGNLKLTQGSKLALTGNQLKTITVGGNANFEGTGDEKIKLIADTTWRLAVNGILVAQKAEIKNCAAITSPGVAFSSIESGTNTGWIFNPATDKVIIALQPKSAIIKLTDSLVLRTAVANLDSVTVQWYKDNTAIEGATSLTYKIKPVSIDADSGKKYWATLALATGGMDSTDSATVNVIDPPVIKTGLAGRNAILGDTIIFKVTATGYKLSYQWYRGSEQTLILGDTTSTHRIEGVTAADSNVTFTCKVSGPHGPTLSTSSLLKVFPREYPIFTVNPIAKEEYLLGDSVSLTAKATSALGNVTLTWYNTINSSSKPEVSNFRDTLYKFKIETSKKTGTYRVWVKAMGVNGLTMMSDTAVITVVDEPTKIKKMLIKSGFSINKWTLQSQYPGRLTIVDLRGVIIQTKKLNAGEIYFLPIKSQKMIELGQAKIQFNLAP